MKLLKCICGGTAYVRHRYDGFVLRCKKCGQETSGCSWLWSACREWNKWQRMQPGREVEERDTRGAFRRMLDDMAYRWGF